MSNTTKKTLATTYQKKTDREHILDAPVLILDPLNLIM